MKRREELDDCSRNKVLKGGSKKVKRLILAAALLLPIGCWAADQDGYFRPYFMTSKGINYARCKDFVIASNLARQGHFSAQNQFNQWLDGFLTAYDMYTPDTYDIGYGKDIETMDIWLENYCAKHPDSFFNNAVESLIFELYPNRAQTKPKQ